MTPQCSAVLRHLRKHGRINPRQALDRYGIFRLAARINDLRRDGFPVRTVMRTEHRRGAPVRFAEYRLESVAEGAK